MIKPSWFWYNFKILPTLTKWAFVVLSPIFLAISCTPDPPPTLNYQDRQLVDSLYRLQVDSLKPLLDSLCTVRFDSAVQRAVDSIGEERQSEKEKYLERLRRELGN